MQGDTSSGQRRRLRGDTQVGWAGQEGLARPMPRTRALAEVSQYPVCSFTTPVGEESPTVPGYLKITHSASQPADKSTDARWKRIARTCFFGTGMETPLLYLPVLG